MLRHAWTDLRNIFSAEIPDIPTSHPLNRLNRINFTLTKRTYFSIYFLVFCTRFGNVFLKIIINLKTMHTISNYFTITAYFLDFVIDLLSIF